MSSHQALFSPPKQSLDHLILFVPANLSTNLPQIPAFFTNNFTITPGGVHADGLTSNALILLADGCYIELISFIAPDANAVGHHWWGPDKRFTGWKDWCLTNVASPEENWEQLGREKGSHAAPVKGGRKRADDVEVRWAVTFPSGAKGGQDSRGRVPFFCHDVTPRNIRVPIDDEKTRHTCGVQGVGQLTVIVRDQEILDQTRRVWVELFGDDGVMRGDELWFVLNRMQRVEGLGEGARIVLRLPRNEEERSRTESDGFWYGDVVLRARAGDTKEKGTRRRLDEGEDLRGLWVEYI